MRVCANKDEIIKAKLAIPSDVVISRCPICNGSILNIDASLIKMDSIILVDYKVKCCGCNFEAKLEHWNKLGYK